MLQKQYRLPAYVKLAKPRSYSMPLFFLKTADNNLDHSRFGFVVSKKTDKRATARNRIKRLFRSCVEEALSEIKPGHDMLFVLKSAILEIERKELYNEIYSFLKNKEFLIDSK